MTKHQVSCTVAGCAICGDHPMEMDITYADTSPPCPSCAALRARIAKLEKVVEAADRCMAEYFAFQREWDCILPAHNPFVKLRAALDAAKEGKG